MTTFVKVLLLLLLACSAALPAMSLPLPGVDSVGNRTRRHVHCRYELEYSHNNLCCAVCPAGTHVTAHCSRSGEMGKCEACDDGITYTEHANDLNQCLKCTQCRSDQEVVKLCTATLNAECRCKSGLFCSPDEACEVCKKCKRCGKDEEVVRNCTATTNTECKKVPPKSDPDSANTTLIVSLIGLLIGSGILIMGCAFLWRWWKKRQTTEPERNSSDDTKTGQHVTDNCLSDETRRPNWQQLVRTVPQTGTEEERKVLCESLSSSASNSQHSLTGLPCSAYNPPQCSPAVPVQLPNRRKDEDFPKLVPVNGEESLRKCFEYFEEVDVNFHKRFFRQLGVTDNVIKSKDNLPYEDRIDELLKIWMEREGRDASLNSLLKALLDLNQRRTAEVIVEKALSDDLYVHEC
ncbi:tumor necrosis factor receptor superfamily member 10B-like isoform X1 [Solea senegalensis]|uniref:Tumor necrosis factor receptor superfamily member 10B-like isoform X1 n=1 Tax=Solea senegalensis TaxID=28829 RepID=A0AAV6QEH2_SOLSE|nr:hematopoietic death receptor isoform X1 [Solea senegalensis]KAG7489202.1 tumor necrosis factor receptor superfamily member 10B-like isoform X1 [Solea senegalensis]